MDFIVTRVSNHDELKPQILKYVEEFTSPYDTSTDTISKTDWNTATQRFMNRKYESYLQLLETFINGDLMENVSNTFGGQRQEVLTYWFQQYNKLDTHVWHNHPSCHFSNVYYVEMNEGAPFTEFYDPTTNKTFVVEGLKEGDVLTFPAWYIHRSPPVLDDTRKTVVVFNTNVMTDVKVLSEKLGV